MQYISETIKKTQQHAKFKGLRQNKIRKNIFQNTDTITKRITIRTKLYFNFKFNTQKMF